MDSDQANNATRVEGSTDALVAHLVLDSLGRITPSFRDCVAAALYRNAPLQLHEQYFGSACHYLALTVDELIRLVSRRLNVHAANLARPALEFGLRAAWIFGLPQPTGWYRAQKYFIQQDIRHNESIIQTFGPSAAAASHLRELRRELVALKCDPMPSSLVDIAREVVTRSPWGMSNEMAKAFAFELNMGVVAQLHMASHAHPTYIQQGSEPRCARDAANGALHTLVFLSFAATPLFNLQKNPYEELLRDILALVGGHDDD